MSGEIRSVAIGSDMCEFLEELGFEFIRASRDEDASKLLALALAWKVSPRVGGGTSTVAPPNVVPFPELHSRRVGA